MRYKLKTAAMAVWGAVALANQVEATTSVANPTVTPSAGGFTWSYDATHSNGQLRADDPALITIYDFKGYIAGTAFAPLGWSFSSAGLGVTPADLAPIETLFDDPAVPNLTWTYTDSAVSDAKTTLHLLGS